MKRSRRDLVRVGALVLTAGMILAGGLLWIAGSHWLRPVAEYVVRFEDSVSGLNAGANVEYKGVVVGRVRDLQLTGGVPPAVAVLIDVAPDTPVRTDTTAELLGSLVTGIKYVELQGGSGEAPPLPEHGTIPGDVTSLDQFRERLARVTDRAVTILRRIDEEVLTPDNTRKFGALVSDLSSAAGTVNATLAELRSADAARSVAEVARRLADLTGRLDGILTEIQGGDVTGRAQQVLQHLDEAAVAMRDVLRTTGEQIAGERASLAGLITELTRVAERMQETLDVIRADPSLVLWSRPIPERELER